MTILMVIWMALWGAETLWAGTVLPEQTRDRKSLNSSAAAVSWSQRTGVGSVASSATLETERDGEALSKQEQVSLFPFLFLATGPWSFEGSLLVIDNAKTEVFGTGGFLSEFDVFSQQLRGAYRLTEKWAVGAEFNYTRRDTLSTQGTSQTRSSESVQIYEATVSYKPLPEVYTALGYRTTSEYRVDEANTSSLPSLTHHQYFLGVGYQSQEFTLEKGWNIEISRSFRAKKRVEDREGDFFRRGDREIWSLEALYRRYRFEFDLEVDIQNSKNFDETTESKDVFVNFDVECTLPYGLYITPGVRLNRDRTTISGAETKTRNHVYFIDLGRRSENYDVTLSYGIFDFRSESSTGQVTQSTGDRSVIQLNYAHFF